MKKRLVLLIMSCCMFFCIFPVSSYAALPPQVEPQWTNTMNVSAEIYYDNNTGYVDVTVSGKSGVTNITATIKLYYKNSSGGWTEILKNWTYDVDQRILCESESFTAVEGREYKIVLSAHLDKNGVTETVSKTATAVCPSSK